ncbi:MAG TPA: hypothetical protein VF181_01840 [Balneolaceae bacterium]
MNNDELTKAEALKLITSVVDDEVSEKKREAFFSFITKDDEVRRKYESLKKLKALLYNRYPRACAPQSLKNKIRNYIRNGGDSDYQTGPNAPVYDIPAGGPSRQTTDRKTRLPIREFSSPKYLG